MTSEEALATLGKITTLLGPHIAPDWPVGLLLKPTYFGYGSDDTCVVLGYTTRGWLVLGRTDGDHSWCVTLETAKEKYKPLDTAPSDVRQ